MLIETALKPRTDGTVSPSIDGVRYTFKATEPDGPVVCEVTDADHIARLLNTGNFYPASDVDYDEAIAIVNAPDEELVDEDDEPVVAPTEANTPPKPGRPRKAK